MCCFLQVTKPSGQSTKKLLPVGPCIWGDLKIIYHFLAGITKQ